MPCYALYGDDPYLIKRAREMFLSAFAVFPEFNVVIFDETAQATDVVAAAQTMPLMSDRRLVVAPVALLKDLTEYLKAPENSCVLVLQGQSKQNTASGICVEWVDCSRLEPSVLSNFIAIECANRSCTIQPDASLLLGEYCGRYAGKIISELEKLSAYKNGGTINCDDVRLNVAPLLEYKVFELTDAIIKKNAQRAEAILNDMLVQTAAAAKVFGLIYAHFRKLMYASLSGGVDELASSLDIKEFSAKMLLNQSKAFLKQQLKEILDKLHRVDSLIKNSTAVKPILSSFIYEVMLL